MSILLFTIFFSLRNVSFKLKSSMNNNVMLLLGETKERLFFKDYFFVDINNEYYG
jgi:hypothetical protein